MKYFYAQMSLCGVLVFGALQINECCASTHTTIIAHHHHSHHAPMHVSMTHEQRLNYYKDRLPKTRSAIIAGLKNAYEQLVSEDSKKACRELLRLIERKKLGWGSVLVLSDIRSEILKTPQDATKIDEVYPLTQLSNESYWFVQRPFYSHFLTVIRSDT